MSKQSPIRRAYSKYRAVITEVDGMKFHSKREAKRYCELRLLEKAGHIVGLEMQPAFDMRVNDKKIGVYRADFAYWQKFPNGTEWIVEDVKGYKTPAYRLKKKLIEAQYGIEIREV